MGGLKRTLRPKDNSTHKGGKKFHQRSLLGSRPNYKILALSPRSKSKELGNLKVLFSLKVSYKDMISSILPRLFDVEQ